MQLAALLRLGFPSASYLKYLTLLHITTRWLVLQKARHHTLTVLWPVVGTRFQILFHSPSGVLFTFPSRYCFTIGHQVVFSLGRWSSLLPTGFHVSGGTLGHSRSIFLFAYRSLTFYGAVSQQLRLRILFLYWVPATPKSMLLGLGSFRFARRY